MIFAGHNLICENGTLLAESALFSDGITYGDVDTERLVQERRRMNTWRDAPLCTVLEAGLALPRIETARDGPSTRSCLRTARTSPRAARRF